MFLNNIDLTGALFNLRLSSGNEKQKSKLGGLITFLIYLTSLAYAIYISALWGLGNILPKVTQYQKVTNQVSLNLPQSFISVELSTTQNPFKKDNNILTPIIYYFVNGEVVQTEAQFSEDTAKINLPQTTLSRSENTSNLQDKSMLFVFAICQTSFQFGQTCASQETIQEYLNQLGDLLQIDSELTQYNQQSNSFDKVAKDSRLVIDPQYILYNQVKLKTTYNQHDVGYLFQNYEYQTFVHDRELITQPVSSLFVEKYFSGLNPIYIMLITIDAVQTVTIIVETKISEVFAQIGAIVSILMTLQIISANYNSIKLETQLKDIIVQYIYPKLRGIKIQKTFYGKITQIQYYGKILSQDQQQTFILKYNRALEEANKYLAILTLIYKLLQIEQFLNLKHSQIQDIEPMQPLDNNVKIQPKETGQEEAVELQENSQISDPQEIFRK